jgi:hypothetical protein
MPWTVHFHDEFAEEFMAWRLDVQRAATTVMTALEQAGPVLGRPQADTLHGSKHANMKELRFSVRDGEWRIAFAFDAARRAILLVGGNKLGMAQDRFYRRLIATADKRLEAYLATMKAGRKR